MKLQNLFEALQGLTQDEIEAVKDALLNTYNQMEDSGEPEAEFYASAYQKLFGTRLG